MNLLLNEAIMLGSMLRRQCFGKLKWNGRTHEMRTCAIGAALEAVGAKITDGAIETIFPYSRTAVTCPQCGSVNSLADIIVCLNDSHRWTRERIAEWVSTIEPAELATASELTEREAVSTK